MDHSVTDTSFALKNLKKFFGFVAISTLLTAESFAQTTPRNQTQPRPAVQQRQQGKQPTRTVRTRRQPPKPATPPAQVANSLKLGLSLWGENIALLAADGRSEEVDIKYSGLAIGYEIGLKWTSWAIWAEAQTLFLQGQASSANNSIQYRDKIKPNVPFLFDFGFSYLPSSQVSLSLGAGALFHSLTLEPPTSVVTTYEFKYSKPLKPFLLFRLNWDLGPRWSFEQKIMAFTDSQIDTGWAAALGYRF